MTALKYLSQKRDLLSDISGIVSHWRDLLSDMSQKRDLLSDISGIVSQKRDLVSDIVSQKRDLVSDCDRLSDQGCYIECPKLPLKSVT